MANTNDEAEWDTGAPEHLTTSPESGLHLAPAALMARIQEALTTSSRTEAALADLAHRTVSLCDGQRGLPYQLRARSRARSATGHARRPRGNEHRPLRCVVGLARRARAVTNPDSNASLPRQQLIADHDRFIAMLMADHERELEALRQHLAESQPSLEP